MASSPDPGALALELFERHHGALRAYLRLATGSADLAEDLAQDVFVRVVARAGTYEPRGRDRAWLFSIARHRVVDYFRQRPALTVPLIELVGTSRQVAAISLKDGLRRLPDREREAFLLSEVGGLTYAEIAQTTESTVPSVRSAIYRARVQLRSEVVSPDRVTWSQRVVEGDQDD